MRLLDEILMEMAMEDNETSFDSESSLTGELKSAIRSLNSEQRNLVLRFVDYLRQSENAIDILKDISDNRDEISESVNDARLNLEVIKESNEAIASPDESTMNPEEPNKDSRVKKIWGRLGRGLRGFFRYIGKGFAWIATHPITIAKLVLIAVAMYKFYLLYGDVKSAIDYIKGIWSGLSQQTKEAGQEWLDAYERWKDAGLDQEPNGFFGREEEISPAVRHRIKGLSGSWKPQVRQKGPRHH